MTSLNHMKCKEMKKKMFKGNMVKIISKMLWLCHLYFHLLYFIENSLLTSFQTGNKKDEEMKLLLVLNRQKSETD